MAKQLLFLAAFVFLYAGAWAQATTTVASGTSSDTPILLEVWGAQDASVSATPVERTSPNGNAIYGAYDINITKDGREWQPEPEQPAMVTMQDPNFADGQMLDIYHEGANGLEFVATVASENGKITFPAHSFSVYIVAEAGDYARLKVNLHRADGSVVTIWVKKLDLDTYQGVGNFNRIVYNPGMGTPATGVDCMGWIAKANYEKEDIPNALTYEQVRDSIRNRVSAGVTDGTQLDFYAMLFKHYSVTYLAENESVQHTDVISYRADVNNPTLNYYVDALYTPASSTQNFEGWLVSTRSDGEHISGHTNDFQNYANRTEIGITGDVTFRVNVSEGHWLIYHENGKGATYKAADFVRAGEVTVNPQPVLEMRRNGYTFVGWYLGAPTTEGDDPTGALFSFGGELTENTHVYAKWQANTTADYSVIIWKQNINGDGYDFEEIITMSGNVGDLINTVSQQGSGTTSYARINSRNYQYTGFRLDRFDRDVRINTEGNAVLNVYYDRNSYTLTFQIDRGGWFYSNWTTIKTITALYEQDISTNFPIQGTNGVDYTGYVWEPQNSRIFTSGDVPSLDAMREENTTFHAKKYGSGTTIHMYYYTEALGSTNIQYQGRYFDEHQHVQIYSSGGISSTEDEDFINILGYEHLGSNPAYSGGSVDLNSENRYTIKFYYTRKFYIINFMSGAYFDGNNNNLSTDGSTQIETVSGIAYGADVSSYNDYTPSSVPGGYVFEGWYADKTCTRPFDFATMPSANVTVYAKWRQIQYRVFLHPNVDAEDISLNWGDEEQEMNFRITCGDKVSTPTGIRADYEFVGWYTDEQFRHAFNADATPLNETTVTTPYNKTTDYTDPMDKYGNIGDNPRNSDAIGNNGGDRFWITKKFDLYGKWKAILRGAIGIKVEYLANGGDNVPTDTLLYQDMSYAVAGHASSHATKEFSHWVLQHWNQSTGDYEDTGIHIYPGAAFLIHKGDARMHDAGWYNADSIRWEGPFDETGVTAPSDAAYNIFRATYTLKLRAEYIEKENPPHTFIQWFWNNGTNAVYNIDGESTTEPTLGINEAVVPPTPTRTGYIFKGWYESDESGATITACAPNFLHYNNGVFAEGSRVADDNYGTRKYLYAIWEPIVEFDIDDVCPGAPIELPLTTKYNVNLSATGWTWSASAGTVAGRSYTASSPTSVTLTFTPASSTCAQATNFVITPKTPNVPNASSYNFIWRGGTASHLTDWNTTSNWYVYNSGYSIATAMPTSESKVFIGPADCITENWPSQTAEASAKDITIASGASLTVPEGKTLNIAGNLDIAAGATFSADNTNSKVVFNGSSDQSINRPVTFRDVKFAQTGVHQITIPEMMTVNGKATFEKGIVNANATFNNDASAEFADGARYNSYVSGTVTKKGNPDSFTFPLGDDGVLGAFTTKIENNTDKGVSIKFNHKRDGEGNGFSIEDNYPRWWNINDMCAGSNALPRFDHVSNYEYWEVVDMSEGTSLSTITLKVDANDPLEHFNSNFSGRDNEKIYAAAHFDCWKNIGGPAEVLENSNQTITVNVSSISRTRGGDFDGIITLGSIDHNIVLPIELTSFSATCDGHSTLVEWATASEKNNDYFSLERSDDAINFVEIARIAGAGNSIERLDYSYTDFGVHGGDNYYRLVQVDYDGTRTASEIIVANCSDMPTEEPEVVAYPNPFDSDLTVELENFGDRPARIDVYDVLGRLVYTEEVAAPQNDYQTVLHLGGLSDATYTVRVATSDFVINRKVVKQQ